MGTGRLVNVSTSSANGEFVTIGYLVAEPDAKRAIEIIVSKVAKSTDEIVEVCRVSEELLDALGVPPGGFRRADSDCPKSKQ